MAHSAFPILEFENIFKTVIWGGKRIAEFKGLPSQGDHVGESWELSPMPGHVSVVKNGPYRGQHLDKLVETFPIRILGNDVYERFGAKFPLLIKFIDSNDDLSIQVHPDDALALKRHDSLGKTEMWYSIAPAEGAYLYAGFSEKLTPEQFKERVKDNTIVAALNKFYTHPGDVFFLPAGRVHSIGRGNFVLEIQEASDITYRIYDYDRRDADGKPRQLHLDESVDAINYDDVAMTAGHVDPQPGHEYTLEQCPFFTTKLYDVDKATDLELAPGKSFTVLIAVAHDVVLTAPDGAKTLVEQGNTVLIPAEMESVTAAPLKGTAQFVTAQVI